MSVRAKHDKVRVVLRRLLENVVDGESDKGQRDDVDTGVNQRVRQSLKTRIWRGKAFCALRRRRSRRDDVHRGTHRNVGGHWLNDVQ